MSAGDSSEVGTGIAGYPASRTGRVTMDSSVRKRLEQDLKAAVGRLRQMGATVAGGDLPRAVGGNSPFADEGGVVPADEGRWIGVAARGAPVRRVEPPSAAVDRPAPGARGP